jgi:hypothetical protein
MMTLNFKPLLQLFKHDNQTVLTMRDQEEQGQTPGVRTPLILCLYSTVLH